MSPFTRSQEYTNIAIATNTAPVPKKNASSKGERALGAVSFAWLVEGDRGRERKLGED